MSRLLPSLATSSRLLLTRRGPPNLQHGAPNLQRAASSFLQDQPSPPRLPADQQAEFERLQRAAEAALSSHTMAAAAPSSSQQQPSAEAGVGATVSPGTFSAGMRKGAPPEFEGEQNPLTGEVGGPKNEPLRWGSEGDWSYNGRVTDF